MSARDGPLHVPHGLVRLDLCRSGYTLGARLSTFAHVAWPPRWSLTWPWTAVAHERHRLWWSDKSMSYTQQYPLDWTPSGGGEAAEGVSGGGDPAEGVNGGELTATSLPAATGVGGAMEDWKGGADWEGGEDAGV